GLSQAAPNPLYSYYHGGTPKSLIDHILLSQGASGHITKAGVSTGSFFGSISDHRPLLLGLSLRGALPGRSTIHALQRPPLSSPDINLADKSLVAHYQTHMASITPTTNPLNSQQASATLHSLSLAPSAWLASDQHRNKPHAPKRKHFDGWSPTAMAYKYNLMAIYDIHSHLRGYHGARRWSTQNHMNSGIYPIIDLWVSRVKQHAWPHPSIPQTLMDVTGYGPSFWRTCTLEDISHPSFCPSIAQSLLKRLHGRNRADLRSKISEATAARERSRILGRTGRVIRSIMREEVDMYNLDYLHLDDGGSLTDHRALHNLITTHFTQWYRGPTTPHTNWQTVMQSKAAFVTECINKFIPMELTDLLWEALTDVPNAQAVKEELASILHHPPPLHEFLAAVRGHKGSTAPGATGLTYNMLKAWPEATLTFAYQCLELLWREQCTPDWMKWCWLCPKPKDPEAEVTL
ncbi:MAG: hypothetical protein CGW95_11955, partial [Phenylobacterium zucineum]